MSKDKKPPSELVVAAQALDEELARAEVMSRSVRRIRLDSEKNLTRAAEELGQVQALPERIGGRLQALATAMGHLQERQQAALEPLATFAGYVQQRKKLFGTHMQTFAALGQAAGELSAALRGGATSAKALAQAETQLQGIADRARTLLEAARKDDFPEIASEADALMQRMGALRKRLGQRGSA